MASSGHTSTLSHKRIRAIVRERKKRDIPETLPREATTVASRADDAQRNLSQPVKAGEKRRKKPWRQETIQVVLLGAVVIGAIAAILGLRYLAKMVGVN